MEVLLNDITDGWEIVIIFYIGEGIIARFTEFSLVFLQEDFQWS